MTQATKVHQIVQGLLTIAEKRSRNYQRLDIHDWAELVPRELESLRSRLTNDQYDRVVETAAAVASSAVTRIAGI